MVVDPLLNKSNVIIYLQLNSLYCDQYLVIMQYNHLSPFKSCTV